MLAHRREVKEMPELDPREQQEQFEKKIHELQTQVRFLEDEVSLLRRRLTNAPRQVKLLEDKLLEARSGSGPRALAEREARRHAPGREGADRGAPRGGREAQPASRVVRRLPRHQRRRLGRRLHRGSQDARERVAGRRHRPPAQGRRGDPERGPERRRGAPARPGGRGRQGQGSARGRPRDRDRTRRRGARGHARHRAARRADPRRRSVADRPTVQRRAREAAEGRGRGARARGDPRCVVRGHRRARGADRGDPRRGRTAVPVRGAVPRAPARGAEGRPALRASGLRQDADRQGRGQVARRQGARAHRAPGRALVLPEHQGARATEQVRRRDRAADPADLPAREGAQRGGPAGHRVLRRDGLDLPDPRDGDLERRRIDDRAAAPVRARRGRDPQERDRDRGLQPRGPDRPGDPAARAAGREDQDRAPRRRAGGRHHGQVPRTRPSRSTPRTSPARAATSGRRPRG